MKITNETLKNSELADRTFVVGGAVRDHILDLPVNDTDFVVCASLEEFKANFPDAPLVGTSFPVFLVEGDEVALSRTEKSNGNGYGAFELTGVGVAIEQDLGRRDFSINAMAMNIVTNQIVDPFNGQLDLQEKRIKTTYKKSFKDDPVRILRAVRFAARYNFELDENTIESINDHKGELQYVTKERIVLEFGKVWKSKSNPANYLRKLLQFGVLVELFPDLATLDTVPGGPVEHHGNLSAFEHTMEAVEKAKEMDAPFHVFLAVLFHDLGKGQTPKEILPGHFGHEKVSEELSEKILSDHKFSKRTNEFVPKAAALHMKAHRVQFMTARKLVKFANAMGKRDFADLMMVFESDHALDNQQKIVFDIMKEMLYNLNLSEVRNFPANQRAQKAHQMRVSHVKHLLSRR